MPKRTYPSQPLGVLLRYHRSRMSGERGQLSWLAAKLGCNKGMVSKWETGDKSAPLPDRETVKRIGRLYSLSSGEVDELLEATGKTAAAFLDPNAATYTKLTAEEVQQWKAVQGPSMGSITVWQKSLARAQRAYRCGELRTACSSAAELLEQLEISRADPVINSLWNSNDQEELDRLWLLGWYELFEAASLLLNRERLVALTTPYFDRARELVVQKPDLDPALVAVALHLEGDVLHIRDEHHQAVVRQQKVTQRLQGKRRTERINHTDHFSLEALTQRLIVLDGPHAPLPEHELVDAVRTARYLADAASEQDLHERTMLLEASGRTLAIMQNPECWDMLDTAITEARGCDPVAYVSGLYSYLVAEHAHPRSGTVDRDAVLARGREGLMLADIFGWKRRSWQIKQAARRCGVSLG